MKPKLTAEEMRLLRREAHGTGNLAKSGLIVVTEAGRQFILQDDERVKKLRAAGGKEGGRPITKKGGKK